MSDCTRPRPTCDECGRRQCVRCGRCYESHTVAEHYTVRHSKRCPSLLCRLIKRLRSATYY